MTLIRFIKERARRIVFNKEPGFKVVSYQQVELKEGVYECIPIIKELCTGKYFKSSFHLTSNPLSKHQLWPYEQDDPVFEEIDMAPKKAEKYYEIIKNK